MKKISTFIVVILSVIVGAVLLFSAYSKTVPISYFEFALHSQLNFSSDWASWFARLIIGLEASLGVLLVANLFGKWKWVLRVSLLLLIFLTCHLIILLFSQGNDVNCGCMGNMIPMSPGLSILKNVILMVMLGYVIKNAKSDKKLWENIVGIAILPSLIILVFSLYPIGEPVKLSLEHFYDKTITDNEEFSTDIRKGKHVLAMVTLGCPHCRTAAKELQQMKSDNPTLPIYFIMPFGEDSTREEYLKDFLKDTDAYNIPRSFVTHEAFKSIINEAGENSVPVLLWIENSVIIRKLSLQELNLKETEIWIGK